MKNLTSPKAIHFFYKYQAYQQSGLFVMQDLENQLYIYNKLGMLTTLEYCVLINHFHQASK